jgi:hypothetical protein
MADVIAPRTDRSARDVAEKILFAREDDREPGKVIFLIGAGPRPPRPRSGLRA